MPKILIASISERLNCVSHLIATYEWKDDIHFYIYDSFTCYDVVTIENTWLGWKDSSTSLYWPKSMEDKGYTPIEIVGDIFYIRKDEDIQLFPFMVLDENVKKISVKCFGEEQTKEVSVDEVNIFAFDADLDKDNEMVAFVYDKNDELIYTIESRGGEFVSVPIYE